MEKAPAGTDPKRLGAYRIETTLGQGGMGEVFLAWDERLSRHVAVKRIRLDKGAEESHRIRFRREARAVARVSHPAIVQIFDVLETEEGDWIVLEHVEGKPLADLVARRALDLELTLRLGSEIADGLAEAHAKGLVHRDLKTENVMVTSSGHAKILDFGLARALWPTGRSEEDEEKLSNTGALVGTVHAMSPEQAAGEPVDHRSDLFALGSLLYEMLTGCAPFRGAALLDSLRRVFATDPPPLSEVRPGLPPELDDLVRRLLAKEPAKRPQNARLVVDELEKLRARVAFREPSEDIENQSTLAIPPKALVPGAKSEDDSAVVRVLVMSDLVDSTRRIESLGDERASKVFRRHDRMARDLLKRFDGVEIDKSDGFLLLFERPAEAVAYALAYHDALAELSEAESVELTARIGIHLGEVHLRRNPPEDVARGAKPLEVEGLAKPTAARVTSLAGARQTLLTRAVFDLARRAAVGAEPAENRLRWLAHGAYLFQGVEEPMEVFEVGREGFAPLVEPEDHEKAQRVVAFYEEPVLGWRPAAGQSVPRRPGWVLVERMGEGGFGEVWLARHKSGEKRVFKFCFEADRLRGLKREVTLFRLLKEALGHRHDIARILDWNFDLAPFYLESEYTQGGNLAEWAKEQGGIGSVPMATRLALVADVAEALAAAHSVGILHKDVKPANVLVTEDREGRPRAQLTDFGIGLLTDRRRLDVPGVTAMGFTATLSPTGSPGGGTLAYLAPELIEGKAATVQADIYSLGVMLYQSLAGDFGRTLAPGWRRDVEDDLLAEDLASFVDGIPEHRPASALEVAERLRGLEARRAALEAERRAREEAAERRRVLERRRRRRRNFWIAGTVAAFVVMVSFQAVRISQEAERANREAAATRQISDFLVELFKVSDPWSTEAGKVTARQILDRGAQRTRSQLDEQPLTRARLLDTMGFVYLQLGLHEEARPLLEESLELRNMATGGTGGEVAASFLHLGRLDYEVGEYDAARACLQKAISLRREAVGEDDLTVAEGLSFLGAVQRDIGDVDAAEPLFLEALAIRERTLGPTHRTVAETLGDLGRVCQDRGDFVRAEEFLERALKIQQAVLPKDHPDLGVAYANLAALYYIQGDYERAAGLFQRDLEISERDLGAGHPGVAISLNNLALVYRQRGDLKRAASLFERSLAIREKVLGPEHPGVAVTLHNLANIYRQQGEYDRAMPLYQRSQALWESSLGPDHPNVASSLTHQAEIHRCRKEFAKAKALYERALRIREAGQAAHHPVFVDLLIHMARAENDRGNAAAAAELVARALTGIRQILDEEPQSVAGHLQVARAHGELGRIAQAQGEDDKARKEWQLALEAVEAAGQDTGSLLHVEERAVVLLRLGRVDEARPLVERLRQTSQHNPDLEELCRSHGLL